MTSNDIPDRTRRAVLRGAALASAGAAGLTAAGCGSVRPATYEPPSEPLPLGPAEDVPAGQARLYREQQVLVWRATGEEFRAFSAVCTHAGCVLSGIRDSLAVCSCHGSTFDPADGAVLQRPARRPLPEIPVRVENGTLIAGPGAG